VYYKVLSETITYQDYKGVDRRAAKGTVLNINRRSIAKALLKEGKIELAATDAFGLDALGNEPKEDALQHPEKALATDPQKEAEVGSLVNTGHNIGEVVKVNDKTLLVKFDNSDTPERIKKEEVEVLG